MVNDARDTPVARRGWYVFGLVAAVLVGFLFALAALGGVLGAASTASERVRRGETFGGDIALAIVSTMVVVICVLVAAHLEHQLRRHHPVARSWNGLAEQEMPNPSLALRLGRGRAGRYSPVAMAINVILFTGGSVGFAVGAVVMHSDADRSARVQHHGIPRVASVQSFRNNYHSSRGGGYYTADIYVSFTPPVEGTTTTVVHYPGHVDPPVGADYRVLVDPTDPGYAELPGSPSTKSWTWILLVVFAVLFAGLDLLVGRAYYRLWQHRRSATNPLFPSKKAPTAHDAYRT